jgi:hypothetical protein
MILRVGLGVFDIGLIIALHIGVRKQREQLLLTISKFGVIMYCGGIMDTQQANRKQIQEIDRYIWILGVRMHRDPRSVWGADRLAMRWIKKYAKKWRLNNG